MNRRERRAQARLRLRMLKGGKADLPPEPKAPPSPDLNTPAGRLGRALDQWLRDQARREPELQPTIMLAVLLQMAAGLSVEIQAPIGEVLNALDTFWQREQEARQKP